MAVSNIPAWTKRATAFSAERIPATSENVKARELDQLDALMMQRHRIEHTGLEGFRELGGKDQRRKDEIVLPTDVFKFDDLNLFGSSRGRELVFWNVRGELLTFARL